MLPPVQSQAAGHAWLSLDTHCHLHYEVLLAGLGGSEQGTITAHLLGPPGMPGPRRLLKGFYGPEVRTCWWEAVWKRSTFSHERLCGPLAGEAESRQPQESDRPGYESDSAFCYPSSLLHPTLVGSLG